MDAEPESPSLGDALELLDATLSAKQREIDALKAELVLRNQDIEDLQLTNRNLSRKIVQEGINRRGIHGS